MNFLEKYNIKINNKNLLQTALTHSSYANENNTESYERLEYLGDAVLQVIISQYLYKNTQLNEGEMSKERAKYVCEEALCQYVKDVGYDKLISVGNGLVNNINDNIIADTFEAVLAVIYLECGLEECQRYINKVVIPYIESSHDFFIDYKTKLQEMIQTDKKSLEYVLVDSFGEAHNMTFKVNVVVDGIVLGTGIAHSKKAAEQKAAQDALNKGAK